MKSLIVSTPPLKLNLAVIRQFEKLFGAVKHDVRLFSTEKSVKNYRLEFMTGIPLLENRHR